MANSTITATYMTSGQYVGKVRITVNIGIGDPVSWEAVVSSKQDHGLGQTGVYGYPYFVEEFRGSNTQTVYKTYSAGNYVVELALKGTGPIDYSLFDVPGGPPPPPTQYHNICQNNVCTQVTGAGANECSTPGVNCTHKVCWNNVCTALDGPGTDECTTIGAACGTPTPTLASITIPSTASVQVGTTKTLSTICKNSNGSTITCPTLTWGSGNNSIVTVNNGVITGVSAGTMFVNCWDSATGLASNLCQVTVTPPPTQYHNICQNNVCTQVTGAGANECSTPGVNCTHKVCWNNVCTALDGPGTDECTTIGAACGTPTATKYNCVSGVCKGPFTTGTYNSYADCVADGCGSGGDGEIDPCDKCTSDQYCLFGTCYKKNDVYMAVGAVVLLMVLTKK